MKVQSTPPSATLPVTGSEVSANAIQDSAFANLMSEAMKANANFNLDYAVAKPLSSSQALTAETTDLQSSQELQPLTSKDWIELQSRIQTPSEQPEISKSSPPNIQSNAMSFKYIDANGKPTKDIQLALQAAQNELDSKTNDILGFTDIDFEEGNKFYGTTKADQIIDWYSNSLNKEKLQDQVKQTVAKFGLPADYQNIMPTGMIKPIVDHEIALAGRQKLAPDYSQYPATPAGHALALETWQMSSKYYVDPMNFTNVDDFKNAQAASELHKLNDEVQSYKKFGVDVLRNESGGLSSSHTLSLARLKAQQGLGAGDDNQAKAAWFGVTEENYLKALQGDTGTSKLESPIQRLASEVARASGVLKPDELKKQYPKVFKEGGLATQYPEIFQSALSEFKNLIKTKYAGTLEYDSFLKT